MAGLSMVLGAVDRLSKQNCMKQIEDLGLRIVKDAGKEDGINLPQIRPKFKK